MGDVSEWVKERRRIHGAATEEWHQGREFRGFEDPLDVYSSREPNRTSTDVARFDLVEDAAFAVDAHNTLPVLLTVVDKVLELHSELTIYELDDVKGVWKYDENDERIVLARICQGCSSDEAIEQVGDKEWSDTWDDGSVEYPCPTVRAIEGAIKDEQ